MTVKNSIEQIKNQLKSKTILDRKPKLKLYSNHFKPKRSEKMIARYWDSYRYGTAVRDGNGWYREIEL